MATTATGIQVAETWLRLTLQPLLSEGLVTGVHAYQAPDNQSSPYVIYSLYAGNDTSFANPKYVAFETLSYTLRVIGIISKAVEIEQAANRLHQLLHAQAGTLLIGDVLSCVRDTPLSYFEPVSSGQSYRHLGGLYTLLVKPKE